LLQVAHAGVGDARAIFRDITEADAESLFDLDTDADAVQNDVLLRRQMIPKLEQGLQLDAFLEGGTEHVNR